MKRREFLQYSIATAASTMILPDLLRASEAGANGKKPNVVLFFTDDQGYSDLASYGAPKTKTPHLDKLAAEGTRFTDFYVSSPVCSASRAALLTGRYHSRTGIHGALMPNRHTHGLPLEEVTIAEALKSNGYATGMIGKWHLGHLPKYMPRQQGFDHYFGLPYSNDMSSLAKYSQNPDKFEPLPLYRNEKVLETEPDQSLLTERYTKEAEAFIDQHAEKPFFLYMAHSMPHVPILASEKFKGKSEHGLYGDVIEELDASVGRVMAKLKEHELDKDTIVIFLSDNGPWLSYGNHGGSAKPLRGGKHGVFEGGIRVPCIMRWPEKIKAGAVAKQPAMSIDIMPTLLMATGSTKPEKKIDGVNLLPLLKNPSDAQASHEALFFYYGYNQLCAMRMGKWKLIFPHKMRMLDKIENDGKGGKYKSKKVKLALYNLESDIGETKNLAKQHPEIIAKMQAKANVMRKELGDTLTQKNKKK